MRDANNNDVTAQFDVKTQDGKLEIGKKDVTVSVADAADVEYDGAEHVSDKPVVFDGIVEGETASITYTPAKGTLVNTYTGSYGDDFAVAKEDGSDSTGNYNLTTKTPGKLTIKDRTDKYEITVVANSNTGNTYDGTEKKAEGFVTTTFTVEGKTYTVEGLETSDPSSINVCDLTNAISGTAVVKDAAGNVVTDQFTVHTQDGTLEIIQALLTIIANDQTYVYNGELQGEDNATYTDASKVTVEGLQGSDALTSITLDGQQKLVGVYGDCIIPSAAAIGNATDNYDITYVLGRLTITDGTGEDEEPVPDGLVVTKADQNTAENVAYALGQTVTFVIKATNIYNSVKTITLSEIEGVTLAQSEFSNVGAGETIETTATYKITEADILNGSFTNTVTAKIQDGVQKTAEATVTTSEPNPSLSVVKTTISTPEGEKYALGETITYKITVTNDGNVTISNISIEDKLPGFTFDEGAVTTGIELAPGKSAEATGSYTVTEADVLKGKVVNEATATGDSPEDVDDPEVTPGTKEDPTEEPDPAITVTKTANKDSYAAEGDVITYTVEVKNTGNVTVKDITLNDNLVELTNPAFTLAPNSGDDSIKSIQYSYTVTKEDMNAGKVDNTATATGKDPKNEDVTKTASCTVYKDSYGENPEDPETPDGTPDIYQVLVKYVSANEAQGTVNGTKAEVITLKDADGNNVSKGEVKAHGSEASAISGYRFNNWTSAKLATPITTAKTGEIDFGEVEGNTTITVTANFQSSGGGTPIDDPDVPLGLTSDHYAYVEGYPDGNVKPDGKITRAETATMIYRLLTAERRDEVFTDQNDYSDVKVTQWFNKAISSMTKGEYVNGYPDGTFKPGQTITRAEFVTILVRFLDGVTDGDSPFSDVKDSHWAKKYIVTAVEAGWIDGYPDGTFKPNEAITRAEAMKIMNSVLRRGVNETSELGEYKNFPDNSNASAWYYYEIIEAVNDHETEGERPDEDWDKNECEHVYDIDKYERP